MHMMSGGSRIGSNSPLTVAAPNGVPGCAFKPRYTAAKIAPVAAYRQSVIESSPFNLAEMRPGRPAVKHPLRDGGHK